jgi:hypothetical protein
MITQIQNEKARAKIAYDNYKESTAMEKLKAGSETSSESSILRQKMEKDRKTAEKELNLVKSQYELKMKALHQKLDKGKKGKADLNSITAKDAEMETLSKTSIVKPNIPVSSVDHPDSGFKRPREISDDSKVEQFAPKRIKSEPEKVPPTNSHANTLSENPFAEIVVTKELSTETVTVEEITMTTDQPLNM